jgi:predicted Rossmann-fold nucleotide-binding protein
MTWAQLGRHKKPILLANIKGFWNPLCGMLDHMRRMAFLHDENRLNFIVAERVEDILPKLIASVETVSEEEKAMAAPVAGRM